MEATWVPWEPGRWGGKGRGGRDGGKEGGREGRREGEEGGREKGVTNILKYLKFPLRVTLTSRSDNAEYVALIVDIHRVVHQV